jgi:hypothetical protein
VPVASALLKRALRLRSREANWSLLELLEKRQNVIALDRMQKWQRSLVIPNG